MNRNSATIRLTVAVVAVAALGGLASCSGDPITKAGTAGQGEHTIVLQMPDGSDPDGLYLAQDIAELSHGALKVTIDSKTYNSELPANETRLTADVRAGRVGFAYQPARDWAAVGVPGFQALMAPFAVTTVAASQRVAASPVAATILGQLPKYGAVGVGLIAGEPRQILSVQPLFTQGQFTGRPIRIVDNPQAAALVSALGSRPVQGMRSNKVNAQLRTGSVAGVETSPFFIAENAYQNSAPYLTSYAVFPKFETLVASKKAWAALSSADQAAIRQAVADTRRHSGGLESREAQELTRLCLQGVVLDRPTATQLDALAQSTAAAAPASAAATAVERQIKALPGTGAQPDATGNLGGCRIAGDTATAAAIHRVLTPALAHHGGGKIPAGTYVVTDTVADFEAGGQYGSDWEKDITFTWHLHADGTFFETQAPDYRDQGSVGGRYVVKGDQVTFDFTNCPAGCGAPEKVRWSYFDGQLTFAIVDVADTGSRVIYTAHPWRKTG
jgi:TRAP-type C4-dicarboxylate transport system substrate-binding protein